jgi:hypothetical protein
MKNIINKLKKGFGLHETASADQDDGASQNKPASFMPATQALRESITGFIVESLQPYVDEKSLSVSGLHFYIVCSDKQQEEAARVALYADRPGMYKAEHLERKLQNHFIQLDSGWFFESRIVGDKLPEHCMRKGNFGLLVTGAGEHAHEQYTKAFIQVLAGQAEYGEYILDPRKQLKFNIGRSKTPQLFTGKIQQNDIVFLAKSEPGFNELTGSPNLRVSRNHAYIIYNPKTGHYLLYPDRGGLPDNGNKLKVHTANDKIKWLNIYGVAHCLCDGDQVELGGEAVFRFCAISGTGSLKKIGNSYNK